MGVGALVLKSLISGTAATATSSVALGLTARAEGKGAAQPINATSHWLYGDQAARKRGRSVDYTTIGLATHYSATVFWAAFFETSLAIRPVRGTAVIARAAQIATLAAIVDYTITPKRFTPGWELVLSKSSMAVAYAAMAAGFALTRAGKRG